MACISNVQQYNSIRIPSSMQFMRGGQGMGDFEVWFFGLLVSGGVEGMGME